MDELIHLHSISDLSNLFPLDKQNAIRHPLIAVVDFGKIEEHINKVAKVTGDFYCILFKNYNRNFIRYGRKVVDFQDGSLICVAPNQMLEMDYDIELAENMMGWGVFFHPDLIRMTPLNDSMKNYTFFSYEVSEALHLSEKEKQILYECVTKIQSELQENIDVYSQGIIVSTLELLLNYCLRFYGRQFITRKTSNNAVVVQIEKTLSEY
ncbi:MAG: AraC family transcriptional regulator, partial [Bacteroidetes bacterium]|nr:AraC family transcriptional regulator [Bacteroidota bacterium]